MQRSFSNAANFAASMRPTVSQAGPQPPTSRPSASQVGRPAPAPAFAPAPGSVSRSEAGVSVDLSAASNTAAIGEDTMEINQQVAGNEQRSEQLPREQQRARSKEADKWFEDSNRNASTRGNVSFVDDDPPFHLPSNSNDQSAQSLPVRTGTGPQPSSFHPIHSMVSSGSEDFRSVIDDLTVENKKLKKENRQMRRQQVIHTHPDKLFEVRMHGLDAKEKKKFLDMLRNFNDTISKSRGQIPASLTKKHSKGSSNNPSSSSTLHSNPVDSAYASGSASGNASASQSQWQSQANESRTMAASDTTTNRNRRHYKNQNVKSYLMNMSRGLLPKQATAMTETARKKLVVRRLEQLYTGKPNTSKKNSQTDQQQQVSTDAANEQKRQTEAVGRTVPAEGTREATILPSDSEVSAGQQEQANPSPGNRESTVGTPNQRPTRPLDLDLSLAQTPQENIAYIRHLGFKQSHSTGTASIGLGAEGPWVPLFLAMNLAQLHMINVTPDFVRQAVSDISDKFEISSNGQKIRWKGGLEGTRMSGESASSSDSKDHSPSDLTNDPNVGRFQSPSRSRSSKPSDSDQAHGATKSTEPTDQSGTKTASTGIDSGARPKGSKRPIFLGSVGKEDNFSYQPIFLHGTAGEDDNDYFLDEDDSLLSSGMREDTTGSGSGQRSKKVVGPGKEEGAVIFYHRAKFCSDLSGDYDIVPLNTTLYARATMDLVGAVSKPAGEGYESRGPFTNPDKRQDLSIVDYPSIEPAQFVDFQGPPRSRLTSATASEPYALAVAGIGNTAIVDNFVLWPKYLRTTGMRSKAEFGPCRTFIRSRLFGSSARDWLSTDQRSVVLTKPNGCPKKDLPPSELPSPGFFNQWSSSESANGLSDFEGEEDSKPDNEDAVSLPIVPPTFGNSAFHSHSSEDNIDDEEDGEEGSDMDDDDADDEIDMLAYERQMNSEEIARREREWEEQAAAAAADDDAESKRSSAATVGDRSFLSDEDGSSPGRGGMLAGQKRERDEPNPESSPAKRIESVKARSERSEPSERR